MSSARITYSECFDATSESELAALSNVYRFLIHSSGKRGRLLDKGGPEDAKGSKHDRAKTSIHE
jgi:hypothetical protein